MGAAPPELVCPYDKSVLATSSDEGKSLVCLKGHHFTIVGGIPYVMDDAGLSANETESKTEYSKIAPYYDQGITWLFESFFEDEELVRRAMIDKLQLKPDSTVIEVGAGSGRDSRVLLSVLGATGHLVIQDLSLDMLNLFIGQDVPDAEGPSFSLVVSAGDSLPFADDSFDALYSFGSLNEFPNTHVALAEFARVVRPGGRIVVGDEGIAPWLEGSEYAEIICTNNPMFRRGRLPLEAIPLVARNVEVSWAIGGAFYLISFSVGAEPLALNLDLPHTGWRGGTLRTRYFGRLEGVNPELKRTVDNLAKSSGRSAHVIVEEALGQYLSNLTEEKA